MLTKSIMTIYRSVTSIIVATPILINIINQGGIVASLLYLPLLMLALSIFFIVIDRKLENNLRLLNKNKYRNFSVANLGAHHIIHH